MRGWSISKQIASDGLLPSALFRLRYSTKSELVYQHLRDLIVNGQIQSGAHLYLGEIAQTLGVSTNPVREALRRLESEGLVVNRPHSGATVAAVDVEMIEVHFLIRAALEGLAVRLAMGHLTDAVLDELGDYYRRLVQFAAVGDYTSWLQDNLAFYRRLFEQAHSPELIAMIELQRDRSPRYQHFPDVLAQRAQEAGKTRRDLLAALSARDGEAAERIHRSGVHRTGEVMAAAMRRAQG